MVPDGKKHGGLMIALLGGKKPGEADDEEAPESGEGPSVDEAAKLSAAKDALAALEAKDPKALSEALSAFVECCGYEGEE